MQRKLSKRKLLILLLCTISVFTNGQVLTFHTHDAFSPNPYYDGAVPYLNWKSQSPSAIAEIYMINETTARVVLNEAKDATTYYFQIGDKVYYYYYNGKCEHYAIFKDNSDIYQIKTYEIISLKNNEMQMELIDE